MTAPVRIKAQPTPNPMAVKFIMDRQVKVGGKISINDPSLAQGVPLARLILQLPCIVQVHFFDNAITVTQDGNESWSNLETDILEIIRANIDQHNPEFDLESSEGVTKQRDYADLPENIRTIEEILDRTIRPGLQADGGDLTVLELDGNILTIQYEGACGGCPSALMGTLQAIQGILRNEFDESLMVVAV